MHCSIHWSAARFVSGSRNEGQDADPDHGIAQRGRPAGHSCRVQEDVWQISLLRHHCKTGGLPFPAITHLVLAKHCSLCWTALTCTGCSWLCQIAAFTRSREAEDQRIESTWVCTGARWTRDGEEANRQGRKGKFIQRDFWDPSIPISLHDLVGATQSSSWVTLVL